MRRGDESSGHRRYSYTHTGRLTWKAVYERWVYNKRRTSFQPYSFVTSALHGCTVLLSRIMGWRERSEVAVIVSSLQYSERCKRTCWPDCLVTENSRQSYLRCLC
jgi:hypothetical protein